MKKIAVLMFAFIGMNLFLTEETRAASAQSYESIENEVKKACNYDPAVEYGKEIPYQTANCLLTSVALEMGVPAEIIKGVAVKESGNLQQFEDGKPLESDDHGIGIMQMTVYPAEDAEKIRNNAIFNIYSGAERLKVYLTAPVRTNEPAPKVQKEDPSTYLERWYFSVLRYNGVKPVNRPVSVCSENESSPYQELVYNLIAKDDGAGVQDVNARIDAIEMTSADFNADCKNVLTFKKTDFKLDGKMTETKHLFTPNDTLVTFNDGNASPSVRKAQSTQAERITSGKGLVVKPTGPFVYDNGKDKEDNDIKNLFTWYPVQIKTTNQKGYVASSYLKRVTTRLQGSTRYQTGIEISKEGWKQSDTVVIATGKAFPDALSGTPLAYKHNAPLLLISDNAEYSNAVFNEIKRLKAKNAILLGGEIVVSKDIEDHLRNLGLSTTRIEGSDRYETSAKIAEHLSEDKVFLAIGNKFADAISIAPYAAKNGHPILLTKKDEIPKPTKAVVDRAGKAYVIGGSDTISDHVFNSLKSKNPVRISGANRYETSKAIIKQLPLGRNEIFVATGSNFPDALSGAVLAAKNNSSILLAKQGEPGYEVIDQYQSATILGGAESNIKPNPMITDQMETEMINLLK